MAQRTTTVPTLFGILHITFHQLARGRRRNWERKRNWEKVSLDRCGKADQVLHQVLPSQGGYHLCCLQSHHPNTKHRPGAWSSVKIIWINTRWPSINPYKIWRAGTIWSMRILRLKEGKRFPQSHSQNTSAPVSSCKPVLSNWVPLLLNWMFSSSQSLYVEALSPIVLIFTDGILEDNQV